jgi:hypothetical protein
MLRPCTIYSSFHMRRYLDVAALTRPQRIRCRPSLLRLPRPACVAVRDRNYSLPAPKPYQRSKDYDRVRSSGTRRADELDYEEVLESRDAGWMSETDAAAELAHLNDVEQEPRQGAAAPRMSVPSFCMVARSCDRKACEEGIAFIVETAVLQEDRGTE